MDNRFSLRLSLDEVINNSESQEKILENIRYANRLVGKPFKVIFYNTNVEEKTIKKFIKDNEKLLFEVNTQITKRTEQESCWFLIKSDEYIDNSRFHYKFKGDIITGIAKYIEVVKHLKRIMNEDSNSWK